MALFAILIPGTVLVFVPAAVVAAGVGPRFDLGPARYVGLAPILAGLAVIASCFTDFVRRGRGTPAPYDPPRELVVQGLYRFVRNPQYFGVLLVVTGEAVLTGALVLLGYAAVLAIAYHLFVVWHEEPALGRLFGPDYDRYRKSVPRWLPRSPDAAPRLR